MASVAAFTVYVAVRIVALNISLRLPLFPYYVDGWTHYTPAGIVYLQGASVDSVNAEHPPLAKYLIGFSAIYLGNAIYATLAASFLSAVLAFLFARKLTGSSMWAVVTVWLLSFDMVTVAISITPMLEPFMIFFGLLGLWLTLTARRFWQIVGAGLVLGFAIASKWTGLFFMIPVIILLIKERKYAFAAVIPVAAFLGYLLPYLPYMSTSGFGAFIQLQIWMYQFLYSGHGRYSILNFVVNVFAALTFHTTTFNMVGDYNPRFHPEGFELFGVKFISFANQVTAPILILLVPVLYLELRAYRGDSDRTRLLLILTALSLLVFEIMGGAYRFQWYFAPIIAILAILASDILRASSKNERRARILAVCYLVLVATWPLLASAITFGLLIHYNLAT